MLNRIFQEKSKKLLKDWKFRDYLKRKTLQRVAEHTPLGKREISLRGIPFCSSSASQATD